MTDTLPGRGSCTASQASRYASLVDTYAAKAANAAGASGTFHEFTGVRDGRRIDFILVSPQFDVRDARILYDEDGGHHPSDHFQVTATIRF